VSETRKVWPIPLAILIGKGERVREEVLELGSEPINLKFDCDWLKLDHERQSFCLIWQKRRLL
jgi:hypothetical protein